MIEGVSEKGTFQKFLSVAGHQKIMMTGQWWVESLFVQYSRVRTSNQ